MWSEKKYHSFYFCFSTSLETSFISGRRDTEILSRWKNWLIVDYKRWEDLASSEIFKAFVLTI